MRQAAAVARKELRQIARDRRTLVVLLVVPVFFLLLFGYALNWDIRHVALAVDDRDRTPESRSLVAAFVHSGYFDHIGATDASHAAALLESGAARAVLVVPAGLGRDLRLGRRVPVQLLVNGANANTATIVTGYALAILQSQSREAGGSLALAEPPLAPAPRVWYNPELRSTLFLVPGLIAYIAMISAAISTALSVVREKERGTIEQVRMAPLDPWMFVAGKAVPYYAVSLASGLGIVLAAMALFGLPMRGSWLLLLLAVSLFLFAALGLGLLVSSVAETQQVAFQLAALLSFLPTMLLSGFVFPIASMPPALRAVTYLVPARYFLVALRAIVLKGAGLAAFWTDLAALAAFAAAALAIASVRLKRQWG